MILDGLSACVCCVCAEDKRKMQGNINAVYFQEYGTWYIRKGERKIDRNRWQSKEEEERGTKREIGHPVHGSHLFMPDLLRAPQTLESLA